MDPFDHTQLTVALAQLAGVLFTERSLRENLEALARLACTTTPDCSGASISMIVEGRPTTAAASDRFAFELDLVQYDHGEGPCVTALGGQTVRVGFIPNDERWPHFAIGPADRRVQSVLSVPAPESGPVAASLNVYSRKAEAFDGAAQDLARVRRRDRDRAGHVAAVQRGSHGRGSFAGTARRGLPGVDGPGHLDVHS